MVGGKWTLVKVTATHVGTVLANPDGRIRSLNPTTPTGGPYHWEDRPPEADGAYELVTINGGRVGYNPVGEALVFGFMDTVPNAPGFSAITLEPLTV